MKPAPFDYIRAESVEQVTALRAEWGDEARILAGGQSLVPLLAMRLVRPQILIDINHIGELGVIHRKDNTILVGAGVRQAELQQADVIKKHMPLLAAILAFVGHPQTRNRGTLCGSLAHADPAAELPLASLLLEADILTGNGQTLPALTFFQDIMETALPETDWIRAVQFHFPSPANGPETGLRYGMGFQEMAQRNSDFALAAAGVQLWRTPHNQCRDLRIAVAGAGPAAKRLRALEQALDGLNLGAPETASLRKSAIADVVATCAPPEDQHADRPYRQRLLRGLIARALDQAWHDGAEDRDAR